VKQSEQLKSLLKLQKNLIQELSYLIRQNYE
jgi:hypothetical protein